MTSLEKKSISIDSQKNVTNFLESILKEIFCNLQLHLILRASIFRAILKFITSSKKGYAA